MLRFIRVVQLGIVAAAAMTLLTTPAGNAATKDTVADRVLGQSGSFGSAIANLGGEGAASLQYPSSVALDKAGNLYVVDQSNNRVLEYDSPLTTDLVADRVFGQGGNFTTKVPNKGGISADSLSGPAAVAVDSAGNVYISDNNNSRVLEYDSPLTTDTTADRVFGQGGSFTSGDRDKGGVSRDSMHDPLGITVDSAGNLYLADGNNNRVLEYDSPLTTDTSADRVFGQGGSFETTDINKGGVSASSLWFPTAMAIDSSGRLYIVDDNNNRVLGYDDPLNSVFVANRVLGQGGSFTSGVGDKGGQSASTLFEPTSVAVDVAGNVYVTDSSNNRMLEYDSPATTDLVADRVFGQLNFVGDTANAGGISASSLNYATALAVSHAGDVYIADSANNRVLEYNNPTGVVAPVLIQGDVNCSGAVDPTDALQEVRHLAALAVNQAPGCPPIGEATGPSAVGQAGQSPFGDVDCNGVVDAKDLLKLLRYAATLPLSHDAMCPDIGTPL